MVKTKEYDAPSEAGLRYEGPPVDVPLDTITGNVAVMMRASLNDEVIEEYREALERGDVFPPIILVRANPDDDSFILADGHKRYSAARLLNMKSFPALIVDNAYGMKDAMLVGAKSNTTHGIRRTNADKRAAVAALLSVPEWRRRSDRWIAEACHVSNHLVAEVREKLFPPEENKENGRVGKNDRTYTKRAGKEKSSLLVDIEKAIDRIEFLCKKLAEEQGNGLFIQSMFRALTSLTTAFAKVKESSEDNDEGQSE